MSSIYGSGPTSFQANLLAAAQALGLSGHHTSRIHTNLYVVGNNGLPLFYIHVTSVGRHYTIAAESSDVVYTTNNTQAAAQVANLILSGQLPH